MEPRNHATPTPALFWVWVLQLYHVLFTWLQWGCEVLVKWPTLQHWNQWTIWDGDKSVKQITSKSSSHHWKLFTGRSLNAYSHMGKSLKVHTWWPPALARAGFIFKGPGRDEVICLWCQVVFGNFRAPVDADALHMAYFENVCEFLINPEIHNEPITQRYRDVLPLHLHPLLVNG